MSVLIETKLAGYIATLSEIKSIQKTADRFDVRYQTVSQAIAKLEKIMGIQDLFVNRSGQMEPNPEFDEIFNICNQIFSLNQRAQDIAEHKIFSEVISLYSTQSLNEAFFVPHYAKWLADHPGITLKLKEDDSLSNTHPKFNEVTTVTKILDDQLKYSYFPFHNFRQKLWVSEEFAKKHGPFHTVDDLKGCTIFMQKIASHWDIMSKPDKELIGYRGVIKALTANKDLSINVLDIDGVRTIDVLCENGIGIMPAAGEPLKLMNRKLVNILPDLSGDEIPIYIKVRRDAAKTSKPLQNLINFIFKCRDTHFKKIGANPLYTPPKLD